MHRQHIAHWHLARSGERLGDDHGHLPPFGFAQGRPGRLGRVVPDRDPGPQGLGAGRNWGGLPAGRVAGSCKGIRQRRG